MSVFNELSVLAVRQVLADRAESLLAFLGDRLSDNARRLESALARSSDRAWKSLEVALSGPSWLGSLFTSRDDLELQGHIRGFLESLPTAQLPGDPAAFRTACLNELRSARRVKLVPGEGHGAHEVAGAASAFARYGDPQQVLQHEQRLLTRIGDILRDQNYRLLAQYVELRPAGGEALLVQAARFFFQREVESDPKLAAGLTVQKIDALQHGQMEGFARLETALLGFGPSLEQTLAGMGRIEDALARQGDELRAMMVLLNKLVHGHPTVKQVEALAVQPDAPVEVGQAAARFTQAAEQFQRQGGLISDLFLEVNQEPAPAAAPYPAPPPPPRRLLGKAFDPPSE